MRGHSSRNPQEPGCTLSRRRRYAVEKTQQGRWVRATGLRTGGPTTGATSSLHDRESAVSGTVLTDVLGGHARVEILTALSSECDRDLDAADIARLAGVDRTTFYEHVDDLLAHDLLVETRTVGNSTMYRIDRDNPAAEDLAQLEWDLLEHAEDD